MIDYKKVWNIIFVAVGSVILGCHFGWVVGIGVFVVSFGLVNPSNN